MFLWIKKRCCVCDMELAIFLNRENKDNVCSATMVLLPGGRASSALYTALHLGCLWFAKCSLFNNFPDVSPHHVEWGRQGQVLFSSFQGVKLTHIVITQNVVFHRVFEILFWNVFQLQVHEAYNLHEYLGRTLRPKKKIK